VQYIWEFGIERWKERGKESRKEGKKIDNGNLIRIDWESKETQRNKLICRGRL
jgi:hypothetical protein